MRRFYQDFACAYGTIWFVLMLLALLTQSHIDTGMFGMLGFPVIAVIYALIRRGVSGGESETLERLQTEIDVLQRERSVLIQTLEDLRSGRLGG